ncbi:AAA family ATPase [Sorangium sp. So ce1335]|uniref:AAA family ATPase n=1 Tax=Sorangium sp. So ce1335 TaxID=3133335 RepID=UPI003F60F016
MNARATPSLRIARLVIENFRTFRGPTEIAFTSGGAADEMPVFHGANGAGKSNALAAIDLFFRVASYWLSKAVSTGGIKPLDTALKLRWDFRDSHFGLSMNHRSWPPGVRDPQRIEVHFDDARLGALRVTLTPSGNDVILGLEMATSSQAKSWREPKGKTVSRLPSKPGAPPWEAPTENGPQDDEISALKNAIEAPLGPGSKPFFLLDARRRDFRGIGEGGPHEEGASTLSSATAERLLALATSLDPEETERWRIFVDLIHRFKTLSDREISVLRAPMAGGEVTDLRFEVRGKQILRLSELSSGEQQVVALVAAVLTSRAALVAIEEPEMSLHPENQELVRDILREQVQRGVVDQIFLESHVQVFDGPEVLRFSRSTEGETLVTRQPSRSDRELRARARESGADEQWVTPDGYTRLPSEMRNNLGLQNGGYLWFLRSRPEGRWEAWTEAELDEQLGLGGTSSKDA